jgi:hypothetical protein
LSMKTNVYFLRKPDISGWQSGKLIIFLVFSLLILRQAIVSSGKIAYCGSDTPPEAAGVAWVTCHPLSVLTRVAVPAC